MHSLLSLQLILAVLVPLQLGMIFFTQRQEPREIIIVGQLCLVVIILADLFSELLFFSYTTVLTGFVFFLQLFLLPMFWKQLKTLEGE